MFTCHLATNLKEVTFVKYAGYNWEKVREYLVAAGFKIEFENYYNLIVSNGNEIPSVTYHMIRAIYNEYVIYHKRYIRTPLPEEWD
jgi:hypothetical protein